MSGTVTRRGLFGTAGKVAAVAAFAGLPDVTSARPNQAAWEAAAARYRNAEAAQEEYGARVLTPGNAVYRAEKREYPEFGMMMEEDRYGPAKLWKMNVRTIRKFGEGQHSGGKAAIAVYCASQMPIINEVDAHNRALCAKLKMDEAEAEFDRLVLITCDALDAMLATPAPHMAALAFKLQSLTDHRHLIGDDEDDDADRNPLPVLIADAMRLAAH